MTRANPRGPRFDYDPEIERTQRRLKQEIRNLMNNNKNNGQQPTDGQELPARADGAIAPPAPQMDQQLPARTVRDYLAEDLEGLNPAVTMPDFEAEHFELKPVMFNMLNTLGQFGGTSNENARQHVKSFLEICNSFKIHGVSNDVLKLKLFPYSLRDKAKTWLNNLQPGSLQSWTQLSKFSYTNMTDHLRNQITSFRQEDDEAMLEAWERYRDLYRRCPMHGLPEWTQMSIFYNSVNTPTKMMLDASANGTLLDKPPRGSLEILDKLAQNNYQHPTARRGSARRGPAQLDSSDNILAQIASLTNMVKNMQKQPHTQEVKAIDAFCDQCGSNHDASECGHQVESSCYVGNYNRNNTSNTYNPAWRNHPNFSWRNQSNTLNPQQPTQPRFQNQPRQNQQPQPRQEFQQPIEHKSLENTLNQFMTQTSAYMARTDRFIQKTEAFMDRTEMKLQNHDATLKSLETQVGQISQLLSNRQIGGFPSDTEVAKGATHEQCKAITTRSGKILKNNKEGTAVNPSPATDTPATADAPAEADEDHNIPLPTTGEDSAESSAARSKEPVEKRPPPPFPQRLQKQKQDYQFKKFMDILKQVHINLPLVEALQQIPNYAKFLKDMVTRKRRIEEFETAAGTETCLALMHNKVQAKKTDPGSFTIDCLIGHNYPTKALCDPGASINLMPKSVFQKLGIGEATPTTIMLQLADHSYVQPEGKIEDILVQVDKFIFPADFLILDCEANIDAPIILGRPFLATGRVLFDFGEEELIFRVHDQQIKKTILRPENQTSNIDDCWMIQNSTTSQLTCPGSTKDQGRKDERSQKNPETGNLIQLHTGKYFEPLNYTAEPCKVDKPSIEQPPKLELKQLPEQLKYAYLGNNKTLLVIISSKLQADQEERLIATLQQHKEALGWTIADIKGISPTICMHKILLDDNHKPTIDAQRRLNQAMKDVVRKEILKWLDAGIIYPISDSEWVNPVQCVPKKGGMTVISNEKNELIPTRTVTGWRVCMDYRKLNKATRKDHFPLPFIDQILDRLAGKQFYCFLDGYSGYNQIAIAPEDQSKTTFTCPYGTFAFRRMPFGLCNAPATFQRCMTAIFSDLNEDCLEIFMDDFSTFGEDFDNCLSNLEKVLKRCKETNLVLNWEKCHFMVDEGIVLGHKISSKGMEVDKEKIEVISKLPPPTTVKGIRSFLGHAGF
ncbi:hypothetical protein GQ457_06G014240 [Hibiscus cannabinus]